MNAYDFVSGEGVAGHMKKSSMGIPEQNRATVKDIKTRQ